LRHGVFTVPIFLVQVYFSATVCHHVPSSYITLRLFKLLKLYKTAKPLLFTVYRKRRQKTVNSYEGNGQEKR